MLALQVLGDFHVELDGREVCELAAQRSRAALLVFLGVEGSTTRDSVVAVLWPEHDPHKARHALSQTLHRLRGSLGEEWLETEGERLGTGASVQVDARTFETLVGEKRYEEALACYRGAFLTGWFLADSPAFERWADQQRTRFERLHRLARREAIRIRRERGDVPAALRLAQEWAEADPLEDEAQHRLIELLAESGRRSDALQQYDLHARLLAEDDLTPLDDTVQLVSRLRQAAEVGPLPEGVSDPPPVSEAERKNVVALDDPGHPVRPEGGSDPTVPRGGPTRAPPSRARARVGGGRLLVASLMTLVAVGLVGREFTPTARDRRAALPPGGRLVLADFGNDTRDSLVAGVVTEALRIDLERRLHSALVDPAEIARVLGRMRRSPLSPLVGDTAREVALRAGVPAVIDGRVGAVGPGFVLSAWIVSAENGRVLDAALATARDSTGLIDAIEALSSQLYDRIRPSLADLPRPVPLARVTTSSSEALSKYTQAVRIFRLMGDATRGLRLLDEAIALDSTFAMAYRYRATLLDNIGGDRGARIEALAAAYRHRDRLTEGERYLTVATYHQSATGDLDEAVHAYEDLLALDSMDVSALNNLGVLYRDLRDFPRAEPLLRRCYEADTVGLTCGMNLAGVVHALGRYDEARDISERMVQRYPENPFTLAQPAWIAAAEHDYAGADTLFANMARLDLPNPGALELWLSYVDMVRGRLHEARAHLDQAYRLARESAPGTAAAALVEGAWMELEVRADTARAIEAMDAALRDPLLAGLDPLSMPYLEVADFFLDSGRRERGEGMVEAFLTDVPAEWRRPADRWLYTLRGRMAMLRGRFEEAREAFAVADTRPGSPFLVLQYLGPLEDAVGRPDSAIVAYERYLSVSTLDRLSFDAMLLPKVLERLAQLHESVGHVREAADYYTRFADLWADGDPELQPRVDAARRRAGALLAEGGESGREPTEPTGPRRGRHP
jgi:DNA-binding SARP family transcriptional activator/Tfp pilus assembly protein PilF